MTNKEIATGAGNIAGSLVLFMQEANHPIDPKKFAGAVTIMVEDWLESGMKIENYMWTKEKHE